ncbi:MAG: tRNA (adenosine(37)-N6)-dimethylallyltransferase MiaA [Bacteroidales bacterium]|nr:tRNA (adenosine(37)-N6)-dimethylallyltransferase MiaA [Bacteroidales bacterium]
MNKTLVILLGPTGIGKTDLSIELALRFKTEIISSDSRQFFREMAVGTAVPPLEQLEKVKHHFIGHLSVNDYYSASKFEKDFLQVSKDLFKVHDLLLMTGGSGLYIDAACGKIDNIPDVDSSVRDKYLRKFMDEGLESIRTDLRLLDPVYYRTVDLKNYKRIIRALEICESTGKPYSHYLKKKGKKRAFNIIKIGLNMDRRELYSRINDRVDRMIASGLEEEARELFRYRDKNALNTVGYKEMFRYFDGEISRDKAIELIKRNSRRYARRQITWWSRDKEIKWFHPGEKKEIIRHIEIETRDPGPKTQ